MQTWQGHFWAKMQRLPQHPCQSLVAPLLDLSPPHAHRSSSTATGGPIGRWRCREKPTPILRSPLPVVSEGAMKNCTHKDQSAGSMHGTLRHPGFVLGVLVKQRAWSSTGIAVPLDVAMCSLRTHRVGHMALSGGLCPAFPLLGSLAAFALEAAHPRPAGHLFSLGQLCDRLIGVHGRLATWVRNQLPSQLSWVDLRHAIGAESAQLLASSTNAQGRITFVPSFFLDLRHGCKLKHMRARTASIVGWPPSARCRCCACWVVPCCACCASPRHESCPP